ncbi:extracellular signal-regulated kinase 7 [Scaptodrosophila lebanonensis]|uniref:Mitogen-activated protein kinase n=1 Tax=Drosophila lebanonensis TaxID=7225 RepID=A0A6J2TVH5_DROLE|nr:extracellular signal-regulated kinase 7 [Scaptodrosophila lebanonensis]
MAHPTSHDRRLNELDHNVERIFDVRKRLGKGAYGIVWKATDRRQKETVALKKIFDAFRDETDAQRTYREVIFLRAFRHHPNIIRMLDIYKAANNLDFYLVFEFMESDLHNVIKKGDILKDIHKRFVMYQLINAIKYMHSGNVIHRDLKPSNILIDSKCRLKVADFGLARTLSSKRRNGDLESKDELENQPVLTDYVATRWYRAPEILVASRKYTKGIDMWSLGCILGEMIRQKPLFQGTSTVNQIEKIVNALPDVTPRDIESIGASFGSVLLSKKIIRDRRYSLDEMLRNCCDDAMGLVKALLVLDPDARLTAKAAIGHPYVNRFRTASADMEMRGEVHPPLQDDTRYAVEAYRKSLYDMISVEPRIVVPGQDTNTRSGSVARVRATKEAGTVTTPTPPASKGKVMAVADVSGAGVLRAYAGGTTHPRVPDNHPSGVNAYGVSTIRRNYTQAWSEQHHHHHRNHHQHQLQQQQQQQHQPELSRHMNSVLQYQQQQQQPPQQQQQPHRHQVRVGTPVQPPGRATRGTSIDIPLVSQPQPQPLVGLGRELAAVAATAPCSTTSLWQAPVGVHPPPTQLPQMPPVQPKQQLPQPQVTAVTLSWQQPAPQWPERVKLNRLPCNCVATDAPPEREREQTAVVVGGPEGASKAANPRHAAPNKTAQQSGDTQHKRQQARAQSKSTQKRTANSLTHKSVDKSNGLSEKQRSSNRRGQRQKGGAATGGAGGDAPQPQRTAVPSDNGPSRSVAVVKKTQATQLSAPLPHSLQQHMQHLLAQNETYDAHQRQLDIERLKRLEEQCEKEKKQAELDQKLKILSLKAQEAKKVPEMIIATTTTTIATPPEQQLQRPQEQEKALTKSREEDQQHMRRIAMEASQNALRLFSQQMQLHQQQQHQLYQQQKQQQQLQQQQLKQLQQPQLEQNPIFYRQQKQQQQQQQQQATGTSLASFALPPCNCPANQCIASVSSMDPSAQTCYKSRINYLESEMAKCKRQLVSYVQDNQQLMSYRGVRYHLEQLQKTDQFSGMFDLGGGGDRKPTVTEMPANGAETKQLASPQNDSGVSGSENSASPVDRKPFFDGLNTQHSYELFRLEQNKLKKLQLKEFLARDESNAFELPDLCNVYKARSYHEFDQEDDTASEAPGTSSDARCLVDDGTSSSCFYRSDSMCPLRGSIYFSDRLSEDTKTEAGAQPQAIYSSPTAAERYLRELWDDLTPRNPPLRSPRRPQPTGVNGPSRFHTQEEWLRVCQNPINPRQSVVPIQRMRPEDIQEVTFFGGDLSTAYNEFQNSNDQTYSK